MFPCNFPQKIAIEIVKIEKYFISRMYDFLVFMTTCNYYTRKKLQWKSCSTISDFWRINQREKNKSPQNRYKLEFINEKQMKMNGGRVQQSALTSTSTARLFHRKCLRGAAHHYLIRGCGGGSVLPRVWCWWGFVGVDVIFVLVLVW